ncbi:pentapeptide repeat protein [Candidatus Magnetoovum chiemensis]|nr:pentapeptide repeat protein [Candidatus Magnetoovum chiemensis]
MEGDLKEAVKSINKEFLLSSLMISFFFKSGNEEQGCEFMHKSFREYLFAERIVETLKEFGRKKPTVKQREKEDFYKDFDEGDSRWQFSRKLAYLLSPHWISQEVKKHISSLIQWEINRDSAAETENKHWVGSPTEAIRNEEWVIVRDALADLWAWWAEGAHLRPNLNIIKKHQYTTKPAFVEKLIEWKLPQDFDRDVYMNLVADSSTTMDGHLGDGLFLLNVLVHAELAKTLKSNEDEPKRVYQSRDNKGRIRFRPTGDNGMYFKYYIARINAAGWYPEEFFPRNQTMEMIDLVEADLRWANLHEADLRWANLRWANLHTAVLQGADLRWADLSGAELRMAELSGAKLTAANLSLAGLRCANISGADLRWADLSGANLLSENDLIYARSQGAILDDKQLAIVRKKLDGNS